MNFREILRKSLFGVDLRDANPHKPGYYDDSSLVQAEYKARHQSEPPFERALEESIPNLGLTNEQIAEALRLGRESYLAEIAAEAARSESYIQGLRSFTPPRSERLEMEVYEIAKVNLAWGGIPEKNRKALVALVRKIGGIDYHVMVEAWDSGENGKTNMKVIYRYIADQLR